MKLFGYRIGRVKKKQPKTAAETKAKREEVPREKVQGNIAYEIVREKDKRNVITKKSGFLGKIKAKREFVDFKKRRFFVNHIIKETIGGKVRYFVRWNLYNSEACDMEGDIEFDQSLENLLRNDRKAQLIKAVPSVAGLNIDRTVVGILTLAMVFGIPIGLSFNDIFHWVPNTVVHWVTRT